MQWFLNTPADSLTRLPSRVEPAPLSPRLSDLLLTKNVGKVMPCDFPDWFTKKIASPWLSVGLCALGETSQHALGTLKQAALGRGPLCGELRPPQQPAPLGSRVSELGWNQILQTHQDLG